MSGPGRIRAGLLLPLLVVGLALLVILIADEIVSGPVRMARDAGAPSAETQAVARDGVAPVTAATGGSHRSGSGPGPGESIDVGGPRSEPTPLVDEQRSPYARAVAGSLVSDREGAPLPGPYEVFVLNNQSSSQGMERGVSRGRSVRFLRLRQNPILTENDGSFVLPRITTGSVELVFADPEAVEAAARVTVDEGLGDVDDLQVIATQR